MWRKSNHTVLQHFKSLESPNARQWAWGYNVSLPWRLWQYRAKKTANFNYNCQFNSQGLCRVTRRMGSVEKNQRDQMNCCVGCVDSMGYIDSIPLGTARFFTKLWSKKTGFWRRKKGCILPREMRSYTCLGFNCNHDPNFSPWNYLRDGLIQIKDREV